MNKQIAQKISKTLTGKILTKEHRENIRKGVGIGENSVCWKGNNVKYRALHARVVKQLGNPQKCEHCGTTIAKKFDWANISGKYEDINDYIRLCRKCHIKYDKKRSDSDGCEGCPVNNKE